MTVNSFLAAGGDNFREFANGANKAGHRPDRPAGDGRLHGRVRRPEPAEVDYASTPWGRRTVTGDSLELSSLAMTGANDVVDDRGRGVRRRDRRWELSRCELHLGMRAVRRGGNGHGVPTPSRATDQAHLLPEVGTATGTEIVVPVESGKAAPNLKVITKPQKRRQGPHQGKGGRRGQGRRPGGDGADRGQGQQQDLQGQARGRPCQGRAEAIRLRPARRRSRSSTSATPRPRRPTETVTINVRRR